MRWMYLVVTVIPTLLGMMITLMILTILIGPPQIKLGGGPSTLVIDNAYMTIDPATKNRVLIIDLHNPGSGKIYIIGIKINNKDLKGGPSFTNPLVIGGGESQEISYIIPKNIKPVRKLYNITLLYAPETGGGIYTASILIGASTLVSAPHPSNQTK